HGRGDNADIWGAHVRYQTAFEVVDLPDAGASDGGPSFPTAAIRIMENSGEQAMPHVAYSGDGYHSLVVWEDRSGSSWDIFGSWVTSAGTVTDGGYFPIGTGALDEMFPVAAANAKGSVLVAYGMAEKPTNGYPRIAVSLAGRVVSTL